jgi:hypothetical protein
MHKATISIALLAVSLILLIIYGADVLSASIGSPEGGVEKAFYHLKSKFEEYFLEGGCNNINYCFYSW